MKPILCIDPGASGGLALLNREGIVEAFPMRDGMTGQIDAIRALTPEKPLVGNRKPATSKTHWILFMKEEK